MTSAEKWCAALLLSCVLVWPVGAVTVTDAAGRAVTLAAPARRIVALAPNLTEMLYAVGAGANLVGAVSYSDWPRPAQKLPRVGSYAALDWEGIVLLHPDLVLVWPSGNPPGTRERLEKLGFAVFESEPRRLADIPPTLVRLGRLSGHEREGEQAAAAFSARLAALRARYAARPPVRVFYQLWGSPPITVNGRHIVSDVIGACGGENVFASLPALAPTVGEEAVLAADPEAIIASGMDAARPPWLDDWRRWPRMQAVRAGNLFFVNADIINRPAPRILDGAEALCGDLELARQRRRR